MNARSKSNSHRPRKTHYLSPNEESVVHNQSNYCPATNFVSQCQPFRQTQFNAQQKFNFQNNSGHIKSVNPRQASGKGDYELYITDSEDEEAVRARPKIATNKIIDDSGDLCQRITNLMKKTRMNSLQRKNMTNPAVEKENWSVQINQPILTPRSQSSNLMNSEEKAESVTHKSSSYRGSVTTGRNASNSYFKPQSCYVPITQEYGKQNIFDKKSMSTQEQFPCGTSTDLSKAFKSIQKEFSSPNTAQKQSNNVRSFGNQSAFSMQPQTAQKERAKYKLYRSKCKKYVKRINEFEQTTRELEFKLKFFEDKNKELGKEIKEYCINEKPQPVVVKEVGVDKTAELDKLKADKKKLSKKCKWLENINQSQAKEIDTLNERIDIKNKTIKDCEHDIEELKDRISKFSYDKEEFKNTNSVLFEAQKKNIEIENRQQAQQITKLQNYVDELHLKINNNEKPNLRLSMARDYQYKTEVGQRSQSCGIQPLIESTMTSIENLQLTRPLKINTAELGYPTNPNPMLYKDTEDSKNSYQPREDVSRKRYFKYKKIR